MIHLTWGSALLLAFVWCLSDWAKEKRMAEKAELEKLKKELEALTPKPPKYPKDTVYASNWRWTEADRKTEVMK